MFAKYRVFISMAAILALFALVACGSAPAATPQVVEVVKEVPVEVERVVEVERFVEKPVEVERVVEREVPIEVEKEVIVEREVPVEVIKEVEVMAPEGPKETIIFGDLNWTSALLQNRIAQYIVEKGYGYPTDVKFGATLPLFQGLQNGDTDVAMEIWLPNQREAWDKARAEGAVLSVGTSLSGGAWQSTFAIPAYLQEQYPELDSVEDLKDDQYKQLFATAETGGKARLVSCIIGWACEEVNKAQIEAYGLLDHVEIINPGDWAAATADLRGAFEQEEPWLGYTWETDDTALELDLVLLEEPPYSDECWFTTKACGYENATVLIAVNPSLPIEAPDVVEFLRNWDFDANFAKESVKWSVQNPDASTADVALWWLNSKGDIWESWVTPDAAAKVKAALAAGETADGWPDA